MIITCRRYFCCFGSWSLLSILVVVTVITLLVLKGNSIATATAETLTEQLNSTITTSSTEYKGYNSLRNYNYNSKSKSSILDEKLPPASTDTNNNYDVTKVTTKNSTIQQQQQYFPLLNDTIEMGKLSALVYRYHYLLNDTDVCLLINNRTWYNTNNDYNDRVLMDDDYHIPAATDLVCHWYYHDRTTNGGGIQVMIVTSNQYNYLAVVFAGTDDTTTALTDFDVITKPYGPVDTTTSITEDDNITTNDPRYALYNNITLPLMNNNTAIIKIHAGFNYALFHNNLMGQILTRVEDLFLSTTTTTTNSNNKKKLSTPIRIITTGHSLGGASAVLTAVALQLHWSTSNESIVSINFGCPRIGNEYWKDYIHTHPAVQKLQLWRLVLGWDLVPRLPTLMTHEGHTIQLQYISSNGTVIVNSTNTGTSTDPTTISDDETITNSVERYTNNHDDVPLEYGNINEQYEIYLQSMIQQEVKQKQFLIQQQQLKQQQQRHKTHQQSSLQSSNRNNNNNSPVVGPIESTVGTLVYNYLWNYIVETTWNVMYDVDQWWLPTSNSTSKSSSSSAPPSSPTSNSSSSSWSSWWWPSKWSGWWDPSSTPGSNTANKDNNNTNTNGTSNNNVPIAIEFPQSIAYYQHYGNTSIGYAGVPYGWFMKPYLWVPGAVWSHSMDRYLLFIQSIQYYNNTFYNDSNTSSNIWVSHFVSVDDNSNNDNDDNNNSTDTVDDDIYVGPLHHDDIICCNLILENKIKNEQFS